MILLCADQQNFYPRISCYCIGAARAVLHWLAARGYLHRGAARGRVAAAARTELVWCSAPESHCVKVIVIGAGVVGVASAWYLNRAGHQVTVLERQPGPGLETSFANGGQVSVSHAEPWASPGTPAQVFKWMFSERSPLLWRPRLDSAQWRWGLAFLRECSASRFAHNVHHLASLGVYSRTLLKELRRETGLRYDHLARGILNFYTDDRSLQAAEHAAIQLRALGATRERIGVDEALRIEPALRGIADRLVGATYTADDESGDAYKFTCELARLCARNGVQFAFATRVTGLMPAGDAIGGVAVEQSEGARMLSADAYVLSAASFSRAIAATAGIDLPIYPAKGYSATVPVLDPQAAPTVCLSDDQCRIAISRLGDRLRIAGTAEISGYDPSINPVRCRVLVERGRELFGAACDWERAQFWAGLRPSTPSNLPLIGRSARSNLFLNTGHGTLGWTHCCGSGQAIADIVSGRTPAVDLATVAG